MRWPEFTHAVRAATAVLGEPEVVVIGSQAIHASVDDAELPAEALASMEIDIAALDDPSETKSHVLAGALGEGSPFHEAFGFFVDGVSITTAQAPKGWQARLVRVDAPSMNGAVALCLESHDLCVAKLYAHREKDLTFVAALMRAGVVDSSTMKARVSLVDAAPELRDRVLRWLDEVTPPRTG